MYGWNNDAFGGFIYTPEYDLHRGWAAAGRHQQPDAAPTTRWTSTTTASRRSSPTVWPTSPTPSTCSSLLKIEGSYAQWSFEFDDGGAGILGDVQAEVIGAVGSGTMTDVLYNSGADLVTSEGATGDPIIAYHFDSAAPFSWDVADGDQNIAVLFNASSDASLTLALSENDPCQYERPSPRWSSWSRASPTRSARRSTPFYEPGCVVPAAAAPISLGSAVNQAIPLFLRRRAHVVRRVRRGGKLHRLRDQRSCPPVLRRPSSTTPRPRSPRWW